MKVKTYLKGFLKGALLLIGISIASTVLHLLSLGNADPRLVHNLSFHIVLWLIGILSMSYLISKHKFPYGWMIISVILTFWMLPFLFGSIELSNKNLKK